MVGTMSVEDGHNQILQPNTIMYSSHIPDQIFQYARQAHGSLVPILQVACRTRT